MILKRTLYSENKANRPKIKESSKSFMKDVARNYFENMEFDSNALKNKNKLKGVVNYAISPLTNTDNIINAVNQTGYSHTVDSLKNAKKKVKSKIVDLTKQQKSKPNLNGQYN